jgi:hypothetical protein
VVFARGHSKQIFPSATFGIYRGPAVRFSGMSDGIGAVRRGERQTEQAVERLEDD